MFVPLGPGSHGSHAWIYQGLKHLEPFHHSHFFSGEKGKTTFQHIRYNRQRYHWGRCGVQLDFRFSFPMFSRDIIFCPGKLTGLRSDGSGVFFSRYLLLFFSFVQLFAPLSSDSAKWRRTFGILRTPWMFLLILIFPFSWISFFCNPYPILVHYISPFLQFLTFVFLFSHICWSSNIWGKVLQYVLLFHLLLLLWIPYTCFDNDWFQSVVLILACLTLPARVSRKKGVSSDNFGQAPSSSLLFLRFPSWLLFINNWYFASFPFSSPHGLLECLFFCVWIGYNPRRGGLSSLHTCAWAQMHILRPHLGVKIRNFLNHTSGPRHWRCRCHSFFQLCSSWGGHK